MSRPVLTAFALAAGSVALHNVWAVRRLRRVADAHDRSLSLDAVVGPGTVPALRLVVLGDSYPAGMGLTDPADTYPHQLARRLVATTGHEVRVHCRAARGARTADVTRRQAPGIAELDPDLVAVLVGANDALGRRTPRQIRRDTEELVAALRREAPTARIVLGRAADLGDSPALPWPLRQLVSLACWWTARAQAAAAEASGIAHGRAPSQGPRMFGPDGFHGNAASHALAAELTVDALEPRRGPGPIALVRGGRSGQ